MVEMLSTETLADGGTGYCTAEWVDGCLQVILQDLHPGYEYEASWRVPEADLGPVAARMDMTVDELRELTSVEVGPEIASALRLALVETGHRPHVWVSFDD